MSSKWRLLAALVLVAACESERDRPSGGGGDGNVFRPDALEDAAVADAEPEDTGPDLDAGPEDSGPADTGMVTMIPDPPMTVAFDWPDTEPNDTPETAVPVGVFSFAFWMGFGGQPNRINNNTDVDFYVFRTGDAMSLTNAAPMQICANDAINLLDLYLYNVTNRTLGTQVAAATSTDPSCETLLDSAQIAAMLQPDSVYLLEVRAAPGLDLGASAGMYLA